MGGGGWGGVEGGCCEVGSVVKIGRLRSREWKYFGCTWAGRGVLKIRKFSWTSYLHRPYNIFHFQLFRKESVAIAIKHARFTLLYCHC